MTAFPVAALCVAGRSIYKHMPGVVAYDRGSDARTFTGQMPVIAHPPCRCWSKYLSHQAKPENRQKEMQLGAWCVSQVITWGGCLEHPAESRLFPAMKLPFPGDFSDPLLFTIQIEQQWFGYATPKKTWVLVSGVPRYKLPPLPFQLTRQRNVRLSSFGRSRTMDGFAQWLYATAIQTWWCLPGSLARAVRPVGLAYTN